MNHSKHTEDLVKFLTNKKQLSSAERKQMNAYLKRMARKGAYVLAFASIALAQIRNAERRVSKRRVSTRRVS
mgnify:FL=1